MTLPMRVSNQSKKIAKYEPNHENFLFSIKDANDVKANLINVTIDVKNLKYHDSPNKHFILLQRLMKVQTINYFE